MSNTAVILGVERDHMKSTKVVEKSIHKTFIPLTST